MISPDHAAHFVEHWRGRPEEVKMLTLARDGLTASMHLGEIHLHASVAVIKSRLAEIDPETRPSLSDNQSNGETVEQYRDHP